MQQYIMLITVAVLSVSGAQACDLATMQTCVAQLQANAGQIQSGVIGSLGPDGLDQLCGTLFDATDCLRVAIEGCRSSAVYPIHGVMNMVEYMCKDENKQIMLDNAQCMIEAQSDVETCMIVMQRLGIAGQTPDSMCNTVRSALSCMQGTLQGHCNMAVADFMRNMMVFPIQPTLRSIGCHLSLSK